MIPTQPLSSTAPPGRAGRIWDSVQLSGHSGMPPQTLPPPNPEPSYVYIGNEGELFHDLVSAIHQQNQVPRSLCILTALCIGAFVKQSQVYLMAPTGHKTPCQLSGLASAASGTGKSTVLEKFKAPVDDFIAAHESYTGSAMADYLDKKALWDQELKFLTKDFTRAHTLALKKSLDNDVEAYQKADEDAKKLKKARDLHQQQKPEPPPPMGMGILSDATPAAISKYIKNNQIKSLGIISAEGEELLSRGIKHQSSILNKAFSGEATRKQLATRGDESYQVPTTSLIFAQPGVMEKAFGDGKMRDTGTVARALWTCPVSNVGYKYHPNTGMPCSDAAPTSPAHEEAIKRYHRWIHQQLTMAQERLAAETPLTQLKLSDDALNIWYTGRAEVDVECRPGGRYERFHDHACRLPEQWLRVSMVLHGYNDGEQAVISDQTLLLAITLVNAFSTEFVQLFSQTSKEVKDIVKLRDWLMQKRNEGIRYLPQSIVTSNGPVRPAGRLKVALYVMNQHQEIVLFQVPCTTQLGKPTKPMSIIDLYPGQPQNKWTLQTAVHAGQQLRYG